MIECHERRHPAALSYVAVMSDPERATEAYEEHQQNEDKLFWLAMICWTLTALAGGGADGRKPLHRVREAKEKGRQLDGAERPTGK